MSLIANRSVHTNIYVDISYRNNQLSEGSLETVNHIPWSEWINSWLNFPSLSLDFEQDCEIGLQLTDDIQIQKLNQQYRSTNFPTDVLAFVATESEIILPSDITEPLYLGDIVISLDTANKQAQSQNHSLIVELAWLASHGLLHILGWDHPNNEKLQEMLHQQSELVELVDIQ